MRVRKFEGKKSTAEKGKEHKTERERKRKNIRKTVLIKKDQMFLLDFSR
jgi:hypothetical protein